MKDEVLFPVRAIAPPLAEAELFSKVPASAKERVPAQYIAPPLFVAELSVKMGVPVKEACALASM